MMMNWRILLLSLMASLHLNLLADTWTDPETGIEWNYTQQWVLDGAIYLGGIGYNYHAISPSYTGPISVPVAINGNPVIGIFGSAFANCSSITSISIPNQVTFIGEAAFAGCTSLSTITVPQGLTSIKNALFDGCTSLTSIALPNGITTIGDSAFNGCTLLTSVAIPEGVTAIGDRAFSGCSSLTSVILPEGVTSILGATFQECSSLASVVIPESVTSIGAYAFSGCSSLTSVDIPESVTSIGDRAFSGCSSLTSITIPQNVTYLGKNPFSGLDKIIFLGHPPSGLSLSRWNDNIEYPSVYAEEWEHSLLLARRAGGCNTEATVSVSSEMTTPKTMKVTYKVNSPFLRAKVRAVAWKDGVRSFANIVPVKTAAEESPKGVPNGEAVTTGVEHTFVWQVAADWNVELAKVAVEVLAEDAGLLPQDLVTIPATETHAKMTFTVNTPTTAQLFNALVWYYADGDSALTVSNGVVRINGTQVANGASLTAYGCNNTALLNYLYGKLGYKVLAGADLTYAQEATEIKFANSGLNQVSVKIPEE